MTRMPGFKWRVIHKEHGQSIHTDYVSKWRRDNSLCSSVWWICCAPAWWHFFLRNYLGQCLEIQYRSDVHTVLGAIASYIHIMNISFCILGRVLYYLFLQLYNIYILILKGHSVINPLYKQPALRAWQQLLERYSGLWWYLPNPPPIEEPCSYLKLRFVSSL